MGFNVKNFDKLKKDFDTTVKQLLEKHGIDDEDKLPEERKGHVKFLRTAIAELDKSTKTIDNKARILTGLMLVIREVINKSYTKLSPEKSGLYRLLPEAMGITTENQLSANDRASLADKARLFIKGLVYSGPEKLKVDHAFSNINGFGFNTDKNVESLYDIIRTANDVVHAANNENLDLAVNHTRKALLEAAPKGPGFFDRLLGGKAEKDSNGVDHSAQLAAEGPGSKR